jgi:hypothetical protein
VLDALRFFPDATNPEIAEKLDGSTCHAWKAKHPVRPPAREEKKVEVDLQRIL